MEVVCGCCCFLPSFANVLDTLAAYDSAAALVGAPDIPGMPYSPLYARLKLVAALIRAAAAA